MIDCSSLLAIVIFPAKNTDTQIIKRIKTKITTKFDLRQFSTILNDHHKFSLLIFFFVLFFVHRG